MRYNQLDSIVEVVPGQRLVARRTLRAEEDYLRDHFPKFPVMPGVMMLESLFQAAMWLVRIEDGFSSALVTLKEAKNVKFGDFLAPGETLEITAEWGKIEGRLVSVKASARKENRLTVAARLVLEKTSTGDPDRLQTDDFIQKYSKLQFSRLFGQANLVKS